MVVDSPSKSTISSNRKFDFVRMRFESTVIPLLPSALTTHSIPGIYFFIPLTLPVPLPLRLALPSYPHTISFSSLTDALYYIFF